MDQSTRERELAPFRMISDDSGKKVLIALDRLGLGQANDVEIVNALDWLMEDESTQ